LKFPCLVLQDLKSFRALRKEHQVLRDSLPKPSEWEILHRLQQTSRTLDEAYYPSLTKEILEERLKDQVVKKECNKLLDGKPLSRASRPVLIVPQLWLWKFEDHVLSANSDTRDEPSITEGLDWVHENMVYLPGSTRPEAVVGLILAHHIRRFGKSQGGNKYQSPLDIFEIGVVRVLSSVTKYMTDPSLEALNLSKERKFMHDISDICSELAMVDEVLSQQELILNSLLERPKLTMVGRKSQTIQ